MKKAGSQPSVAQSPATSPVKGAAPAQATPQPQGGQPAPQQASPQQPAQAPAAGGASVAELQANLARVTEERDQLRKQRDGMSQKVCACRADCRPGASWGAGARAMQGQRLGQEREGEGDPSE